MQRNTPSNGLARSDIPEGTLDRIRQKAVETPNGCLEWTGGSVAEIGGYGLIRVGGRKGKLLRVHRVMYVCTYGDLPNGAVVRHTCDNPKCCRPDHLRIGSPGDNSRDMVARGRSGRPDRKLDVAAVVDMRRRARLGETTAQIAEDYGTHIVNARRAITGRTWSSVDTLEPPVNRKR